MSVSFQKVTASRQGDLRSKIPTHAINGNSDDFAVGSRKSEAHFVTKERPA
jgi:hypothetical protein